MTILLEITPVVHGYRQSMKLKRFDSLDDAKTHIRETYKGCKSVGPIYIDTKDRGTIKTGRIYRIPTEGVHWIALAEVTSETERTCRSISID